MTQMNPFGTTRRPLDYANDNRVVFNFFNAVYAWMCVGLAVTASVAWLMSRNATMLRGIYNRGAAVAFLLGGVIICYAIRSAARRINAAVATGLFIFYSAIVGVMLSGIFLIYSIESIGGVFVITAGTFGAMSVVGYVTKRDLTSMGSFLMMCVIGLFLACMVNIFLQSDAMSWMISIVCLIVFVGLTAYDTQKLKQIALETQGQPDLAARYAIIGSLELYLDFINIFISLLRLMGKRR